MNQERQVIHITFRKFSKKIILSALLVASSFLLLISATRPASAKRGYRAVYKTRAGWKMPLYRNGHFIEGQQFGNTSYRRDNQGHKFHDGVDFSYSWYPRSRKIHAVHGGQVVFAGDPSAVGLPNGFPAGLGKAVVVVFSPDVNIYTIYQEFSPNANAVRVQQGSWIGAGKVVGVSQSDHLHLGMTQGIQNPDPNSTDSNYPWVEAVHHSYVDNGTWLNPLQQIGYKKKWKRIKRFRGYSHVKKVHRVIRHR